MIYFIVGVIIGFIIRDFLLWYNIEQLHKKETTDKDPSFVVFIERYESQYMAYDQDDRFLMQSPDIQHIVNELTVLYPLVLFKSVDETIIDDIRAMFSK